VFGRELVNTTEAPETWKEEEKLMILGSAVSTMAKLYCPLLRVSGMLKVAVPSDAGTVATRRVSLS